MQTKKCIACKRELTFDNYTQKASSPDGYHSICRGCNNYRRKQSYERKKRGETRVANLQIPLSDHNKSILSHISLDASLSLEGTDVNSSTPYRLVLEVSDIYAFGIYQESHFLRGKTYNLGHSLNHMIDDIVSMLDSYEIKLSNDEAGE